MASDGSINAPPLEGADDWTMVNRVSEVIRFDPCLAVVISLRLLIVED